MGHQIVQAELVLCWLPFWLFLFMVWLVRRFDFVCLFYFILFVYLFVCLFIDLFIDLLICLFICLFVCFFIYD